MNPPEHFNYPCGQNDRFPTVPSNEAIFLVSGLIADQGPIIIPKFLDYPVNDLSLFWMAFFDGGGIQQTTIMPRQLVLAMTACKYFDETIPNVEYIPDLEAYQITRRVA